MSKRTKMILGVLGVALGWGCCGLAFQSGMNSVVTSALLILGITLLLGGLFLLWRK